MTLEELIQSKINERPRPSSKREAEDIRRNQRQRDLEVTLLSINAYIEEAIGKQQPAFTRSLKLTRVKNGQHYISLVMSKNTQRFDFAIHKTRRGLWITFTGKNQASNQQNLVDMVQDSRMYCTSVLAEHKTGTNIVSWLVQRENLRTLITQFVTQMVCK